MCWFLFLKAFNPLSNSGKKKNRGCTNISGMGQLWYTTGQRQKNQEGKKLGHLWRLRQELIFLLP